jgi:cobalt-zinc-cadmium efflux system protein
LGIVYFDEPSFGELLASMTHSTNAQGHIGCAHSDIPRNFGTAFAIGTALNLAYVVVQVIFGFTSHSLALLADAGHNFGDVVGLVLAWTANYLAQSRPTARRTYGLGRSSILAALANAILLLVTVGGITWEAIRRFTDPGQVGGQTIMIVATGGIIINGLTAMLFFRGRAQDLNIRGAFLHMAADAAISAGVVVAGIVILLTGWHWIDPVASLAINAVIVWGTWGLLRQSLAMALDWVPEHVDPAAVRKCLEIQPGVTAVHDLHIWPLSTTEIALSAHLVKPNAEMNDAMLAEICDKLAQDFGIRHATIQLERGDSDHPCPQEPRHA